MLPLHAQPDVRLVVADMDGTLLDGDQRVPATFWPLLDLMHERGIVFVPASGRQYATLARMFDSHLDGMPVIAENGALVVRDGAPLSTVALDPALAVDAVRRARSAAHEHGRDVGIVVGGRRSAYVDRTDTFWAEADRYYKALRAVPDLLPVAALESDDDEILKVAVYDFDDVGPAVAPALAPLREHAQVVVSGRNWVDVMDRRVSKGVAVERLQAELGIGREQTVVFGDYLNDLEMLAAADWSFAMADAHPRVREAARFMAPSHREHGVVQTLTRLLTPAR
ncbi:HAD-superfamily hydrolase, subfamily IIB [Xylanimonas cellulosilytica DSM 15894]|uniref:HAD-superfamily hydrolase, subfamily IIB n=1 Tax=Xylanimonas cellulosilytica (strain DSM 15894 / JCM 12276 / CECT 5975 / KCTC 9989 / LMG 20990 / NBRC 107835 / XIL07) TaxID=446471 RepID=D1BRP3_XYLCX|nr:Cof-type HAD-IIB family hydrolase [Xylanimonas cellulosilytica]ACZ32309.1 HAD-superfamily hydrolase, subfamily IIB [Xylanimonas cellulosilytica DSM 15894]